jgi:hypothetical protein
MKKINNTVALHQAIAALQIKNKQQLLSLKAQLNTTYDVFKPFNIIKNTLHQVATSPQIKNDIVDNAIGLGVGLATKKILLGNTTNALKNIIGNILQLSVSNAVTKHTSTIKMATNILYKIIFSSKKKPTQ